MAEYDADRPILIGILSPLLCIFGLLGVFYSLSHLGYLKTIPELESFLLFIDSIFAGRALGDIRILSFIGILFLIGGIGLWSMKIWGAAITILGAALMGYNEYIKEISNLPILAMNLAIIIIVFFHFKEYE